ncbi:TlpA family protein disulfide reductase [Sphingomonas cavernae]|uniref:TlpA family protein disulfide reductase n=1 Tax=Sphingomonas cavernae TaxID=2320861 RepID=UPI001EE58F2D|nr:TlpA disulfide reductase family protein [Sphingomonas cavernae]
MRSSLILLLGLAALGGCDRQSEPAPQANVAAEGVQPEQFTGTLEISGRGTPMPKDAFTAPDGSEVTLEKFRGKAVLVNLWATWCGPCIKEMPALDALAKREEGRLKVLTISQDSKGKEVVAPWFEKNRFDKLEAYLDPENRLGLNYASGMLPTTVLYDAEGKEVWRVIGGMDWNGPRANTLLAETLGKDAKGAATPRRPFTPSG